jgi:hypothetical protein
MSNMKSTSDWVCFSHKTLARRVKQLVSGLEDSKIREHAGYSAGSSLGEWVDKIFLPACAELEAAFTAWEEADDRTTKIISRLRDAEKVVVPMCARVAGMAAFNPVLTNVELETLGLPPRVEKSRQPAPVADEAPEIAYEVMPRRVRVFYFKPGSKRRSGKPRGQHGVELLWGMFDASTPGILLKDLANSSFDTSSPFTFEFTDADSGKRLFFALRWENSRGEKGPWSDIHADVNP